MAPRLPVSRLASFDTTRCLRCSSRHVAPSLATSHRARWISETYLAKVAAAEERWADRAKKIESGEVPHVWDLLVERGFVKDVAGNVNKIKEIMRLKRVGGYVGIDPTADSMHLGHLLPFMALFWLFAHGHPATLLIGGSTARIGDPTDRLTSRDRLSNAEIGKNITKMHYQLSRLWSNVKILQNKYGYQKDWAATPRLLNNNVWLGKLTLYDFGKRLAVNTRMGPLLSRDTVQRKLTEGDGMSVGEFLYPLYQGWDFWHMYNTIGIQFQVGGSDQFGNIVTGIDVLKTLRESEEAPHFKVSDEWQNEPFGFTVPLLTDSSGQKFGKSAGNAMWLDEFKTSPFDLYGYFMRQPDDQLEKLLKLFTFMPMTRIQEIMAEHNADPTQRVANHHLAFEVLSLVYGSQRALEEAQQHSFRFGGKLPHIVKEPTADSGHVTPNNAPRSDIQLPRSVLQLSPSRILFACGLASSASDGQRLVKAEGAYVAGAPGQRRGLVPGNLSWTPMQMWFPEETLKFVIDEKLLILRKGKHNVRIIELVSDEEWKASGKVYPGEPYTGMMRRVMSKLKDEAAAEGREVSNRDIRRELLKQKDTEEGHVANNPDIKLPSRREQREKKQRDVSDRRSRT